MSLSCALLATSLHQWARRYIRMTQPARCSPEKRARMRAYFANGVDRMHIPWAVEGLPTLLHLSLFLFFGGLVIFLFNIDHEVFSCVVWWIVLFSMVYGLITMLPLIWQDSPYYTPLSIPALFPYASIHYLTFKVLASITRRFTPYSHGSFQTWSRYRELKEHYRRWMLGSVEKIAEETASEQSSEIDIRILGWTMSALGDDDSLEKFFEAIPGFFNSKLVIHLERDFPLTLLNTFWNALDGLMVRTLSSNSVTESVKSRRGIICKDIIHTIPCLRRFGIADSRFNQGPVSTGKLQAMTRWRASQKGAASYAQVTVAKYLVSMQERNDDWIALASDVCGLEAHVLQDNIAHAGDNVIFATLINLCRQAGPGLPPIWRLTEFHIHHTLPGLQQDFCTLWNELVQEARNQGSYRIPSAILREIHHHYIALHQGTDTAPTSSYFVRMQPSSYPLCDIASHRPNSTAHVPVPNSQAVSLLTQPGVSPNASPHHSASGGITASRQVNEAGIVVKPPLPSDPTTPGETGGSSQAPAVTSPASPVHTSPRPSNASPSSSLSAALQDNPRTPATTLSHPLEGNSQRDMVAPFPELDSGDGPTGMI